MFNSIQNTAVSHDLSNFSLATPSQMVGSAKKIAPIALAVIAISTLSTVEGGPLTYASCVAGCEALATVATGGPGAAFIMQCIQACWPAFLLTTP